MRPHHAPANRHQTRTLRDRCAIGAGGMGEVYKAADTRLESNGGREGPAPAVFRKPRDEAALRTRGTDHRVCRPELRSGLQRQLRESSDVLTFQSLSAARACLAVLGNLFLRLIPRTNALNKKNRTVPSAQERVRSKPTARNSCIGSAPVQHFLPPVNDPCYSISWRCR
jgi:hypothetical protein